MLRIYISKELEPTAGFFDYEEGHSEDFTFVEIIYVMRGKIAMEKRKLVRKYC